MMDATPLTELGFYALAGHANDPRALVGEVQRAEEVGLGAAFVSERFNVKEAATLCGAAGAVSERIGIATAATNHNTRHPLVTATFGATMHELTRGRFALGLGRGFDALFKAIGLRPITGAQIQDATEVLRALWRGEKVMGHDGPLGRYPYLGMQFEAGFTVDVPVMLVALGPRTLELAGGLVDGVVLHTFFGEEALTRSVAAVRRGAERAGRDPSEVRIWSVLATVSDDLDEDLRLKKLVGRLASYLQGYGDLLVEVNGWDPAALQRFRDDDLVQGFRGAFDASATPDELRHLAEVIPEEWTAAAATGSCRAVRRDHRRAARPRSRQRHPPRGDTVGARARPRCLPTRPTAGPRAPPRQPGTGAMNPVAESVEDLTDEWVSWALDTPVQVVQVTGIGTGQTGASFRLELHTGDGPRTLVAKIACGDHDARARVAGGYRSEVGFYTKLLDALEVGTPRCSYGAISEDATSFTLLLEDLAPRRPGVQAEGCSVAQARDALTNLAVLHSGCWNDESIFELDFLDRPSERGARFLGKLTWSTTQDFVDRYREELGVEDAATMVAAARVVTEWQMARPSPFCVIHGDYRLDNLMFPRRVTT